jgi:hypothetical protein
MVTLNVVNEAGEPALLEKVDTGSFTRYGDALKLSLADYGIDLVNPIFDLFINQWEIKKTGKDWHGDQKLPSAGSHNTAGMRCGRLCCRFLMLTMQRQIW